MLINLIADHHKIKRILEKYNIEITNKGRKRKSSKGYKRKPFTEEHKRNISLAQKGRIPWSKGKTMPKETLYKNIGSTFTQKCFYRMVEMV